MTYPQPHQDAKGQDRTDPWLSLEEDALPLRDLIRTFSRHLGTTFYVGQPAPVVKELRDRCTKPQPGDLVVEQSTLWWPTERMPKSVGYLLFQRVEWQETDEEWERYVEQEKLDGYDVREERTTDRAWYVQYGPSADDVCRWVNCSFHAVPGPGETFYTL